MLELYSNYDVVVCGGGTSGVTAAVAPVRTGAGTLLIERVGRLDGQMNFSGPPGFSFAHLFNRRQEQIIAGLAERTHKRLLDEGHALPHMLVEHRSHYTFSYTDPDWWGFLVYKICREEGVELMPHLLVTEVTREGDAVKDMICKHPGGRSAVLAKVIIDCTREGEVCHQAGAECGTAPIQILEPPTVAFTADDVDWDKVVIYIHEHTDDFIFNRIYNPYSKRTDEKIRQRVMEIDDTLEIGEVMGYLGSKKRATRTGKWYNKSGVGFFLMPKKGRILAHPQHSFQEDLCDYSQVRGITQVEMGCRRQNMTVWRFFKKYVPGFENAYITRTCPEARIRETRRVMGDYVLKLEDIRDARKSDDVIGKNAFPTGAKRAVNGQALALEHMAAPEDAGPNDISYRVLVVKGLENILVAGKVVSADRTSHQRFLQQTIVIGQVADVAVVLCARGGITPRQLEENASELREILISQGVILCGTH